MFSRDGFVVSLSVIPFEATGVVGEAAKSRQRETRASSRFLRTQSPSMSVIRLRCIPPRSPSLRPRTPCRNLFVAQGWVPYGKAGDSDFFKQNAILATATVSSAPAQGGKTMIQYSNQLISSDIPAPPDVEDLRYVDEPPELTFATANQDAIVDFYRKTLAGAGWKSTHG